MGFPLCYGTARLSRAPVNRLQEQGSPRSSSLSYLGARGGVQPWGSAGECGRGQQHGEAEDGGDRGCGHGCRKRGAGEALDRRTRSRGRLLLQPCWGAGWDMLGPARSTLVTQAALFGDVARKRAACPFPGSAFPSPWLC